MIYCPYKDSTRNIGSNIPLLLQELPRALPSGTPSGKGVYLTVYTSSHPNTDTIQISQFYLCENIGNIRPNMRQILSWTQIFNTHWGRLITFPLFTNLLEHISLYGKLSLGPLLRTQKTDTCFTVGCLKWPHKQAFPQFPSFVPIN